MIFVDTSHLLAVTNPHDGLHERAKRWVRALTVRYLVTEYVLWELVNAYSGPRDRSKAHDTLDGIFSARGWQVIRASAERFEAGLRLHAERPDKEWSLTDCISFHVMKEHGITQALTYDHHFEQAGLEALLRRDPP